MKLFLSFCSVVPEFFLNFANVKRGASRLGQAARVSCEWQTGGLFRSRPPCLLIKRRCMKAEKVLFITQEITPYVPETVMSRMGVKLPQAIQEAGRQIRTFMPRWGNINERRNQLHEVIRLSGMNIIIDDTDHTLVIKVASIQQAHLQVYFIDNDDYFHRRSMMLDEHGNEYADNAERAIFYARGVLETVKKLRWTPDVIHCHGWMSALAPLYIKTAYREDPSFADAKVVFSAYGEQPALAPAENFKRALAFRGLTEEELSATNVNFASSDALLQLALAYSDGFIQAEEGAVPHMLEQAKEKGVPCLPYPGEERLNESYAEFFDSLF